MPNSIPTPETFDDLVEVVRDLATAVTRLELQVRRLWRLAEDEGAFDEMNDSDLEVPDVDE